MSNEENDTWTKAERDAEIARVEQVTPETPDPPPVSPDPWKDVERWDVTGTYLERRRVKFGSFPRGTWMRSEAVDEARAADALRHQQEIADLTAQERKRRDALLSGEACEAYRDVRTPCEVCGGWGVVTYGSTATWRGGIGGQAMTPGVCDRCWGSGDEHRRWPSWRETDHLRAKLSTAEATIQQQAKEHEELKAAKFLDAVRLRDALTQAEAERDTPQEPTRG